MTRGAILLALALGACAPIAELPRAPLPYGAPITIDAEPLQLDPADPAHQQIGNFHYAGGVRLTSRDTARLHGLSDLKVWPDGRVLAVSDQSDVLEARLALDKDGRLAGLTDARISTLKDGKGVDWYASGQKEFDSEGFAEFPNGDRLATFEQHDRILLYPKGGGAPRPAPMPDIKYDFNHGIESLATEPLVGPDAYRVGVESTGQTFICRLSAACTPDVKFDLEGLEMASIDVLPDGRLAYLLRNYLPARGNVVRLRIADRQGKVIDGMEIARPLTVDNFEGLAAAPQKDGSTRFYIVVDDNFGTYDGKPTGQTTLFMAFDWRPERGH